MPTVVASVALRKRSKKVALPKSSPPAPSVHLEQEAAAHRALRTLGQSLYRPHKVLSGDIRMFRVEFSEQLLLARLRLLDCNVISRRSRA